ncbi:hypothetical protein SAMN06265349_101742 [Flavobacterium resistens]|uniref:Uncharacterized protein n=1 Tax=Flavobacterium resistens TaxID=443612 RepID=A0A521B6S1_9FLAO|nr:hypothetical protein [Flavobacterium resistens]MRX70256.1 hypothetical protein [Flavobacterium resistens]SMO42802.1 hypothetical protein SAMN06265349_101742 [Flavobacterium resistens]
MGFLLSIIALILFVIIYILDELTSLFINVRKRKWFKVISKRKFTKAFKIDVFANYLFSDFWTLIFSTGGYAFGRFGETLSSCIGKKKIEKTLSWSGLLLYYILYAIDFSQWKNKGHCIASIMLDREIEEFLKR